MTLNGAIMQLVELRENSMMPMVFKPCFDKVIETISELEEPHRGKWIIHKDGWLCSECEEFVTSSIMGYPRYKFCPMCGAKMFTD